MGYIAGAAQVWGNTGFADQTARDTAIRARLQEFHDALITMGLVEVLDTGHMADPSTLSAPLPNSVVTASTAFWCGYKMYRFDDSLQATRPIYLKVRFGGYSTSATVGSTLFSIELGMGTDGALTLTGFRFGSRVYFFGGASSMTFLDAAKLDSVYSNALGGLGLVLGEHAQQNPATFLIERLRDANGDPTDEGVYIQNSNSFGGTGLVTTSLQVSRLTSSSAGTLLREAWASGSAVPATCSLGTPTSGNVDGHTSVYPHFPFTYKPLNPTLILMGIEPSEIAVDTVIPVVRYGTSRSYKNVASASNVAGLNNAGDLLMLTTPP